MNSWGVAGGALGAIGKLGEASATRHAYREQAKEKQKEAAATREQGRYEQIRLNEETRRLLATQRELYGSAGVTLEGAPTDVMRQTKVEATQERLMLGRNTRLAAEALEADARELRFAGGAAMTAGVVGAFSSFFQGLS